jgi:hypothetical protein
MPGIDLYVLEATQDKGQGVSATTYAKPHDNVVLA